MKSGIYLISASQGTKCYVGSSKNIRTRLASHWCALRNNRHTNKKLQNHFNKYGESSLVFSILERCEEALLEEREIFYALKIKPWFNVIKNIKREQGDFNHTKKSKEKIQKASLNLWKNNRNKMQNAIKAGEDNGYAKLTNEQVKEIKIKLTDSAYSILSIAEEYGVSKTTILGIKNSKFWKHILPELEEKIRTTKRIKVVKSSKVVSPETVEKIKLDIITNSFSLKELSEKYEVNPRNISAIKSLQNYKNIRTDLNEQVKSSKLLRKDVKYNFTYQTVETKKKTHAMGKLSLEQINEIKEYKKQGFTNIKLAEMYSVHPNTICYINVGRTFNWLNTN
jgi:group I intron endonuclease